MMKKKKKKKEESQKQRMFLKCFVGVESIER